MSGQAWLFLLTVAAGFCIGFIYDVFRVLRVAVKHPDIIIQAEDVLYWSAASFGMFYFMLRVNEGEVRVFCVVGAVIGMILYMCTLSIVFMKISVTVVTFLKKVAAAMLAIVMLPVRVLLSVLAVPAGFVRGVAIMAKKPIKKLLQNSGRYVRMRGKAVSKSFRIIHKKI